MKLFEDMSFTCGGGRGGAGALFLGALSVQPLMGAQMEPGHQCALAVCGPPQRHLRRLPLNEKT